MNYRLYIDVLWITLCLVDLIAMLGTAFLLKCQLRIRRCVILAMLSASGEVLLYVFLPYYWLYRLIVLCLVSPLLIVGLLYPRRKSVYLQGYLLNTGILLVVGGIQTMFYYWFPVSGATSLWQILLAGFAVLMVLLLRRQTKQLQHECQVELRIAGRKLCLQAYHDTGNLLRDPYTGKPVSIMDKRILNGGVSNHTAVQEGSITMIPEEKLRYIPYHTVGCEHGLLQVMTVDEMTIRQGKHCVILHQPVIGLSENQLFLRDHIHMILHSELL